MRGKIEDRIKICPVKGCWLWTGPLSRKGYGRARLDRKHQPIHRISWQLFRGEIPDNLHVLHRCDVPSCANPEHLFLGTNQDNIDDKMAKRRHRHGDGHHNAKLTAEQIPEIRGLRGKLSQRKIAKLFGVAQHTIAQIQLGKGWYHIP